jgi:predicted RNA-binding Zn-ribbon protein involved in translation (DUF1610 family)
MIKAKEIAMAEYKCPECGSEKIASAKRKTPRESEPLFMILCEDCGRFLGVVNDTSRLKDTLRDIRQALKTSTGI